MKGLVLDAEWAPRPGIRVMPGDRAERRAHEGSQVWRNPTWRVGERPDATITDPHEVLVRPRACGICGSDVHMYETDVDGYVLLAYRMRLPMAVGHEFSGEVVDVGAAVADLRPGDAVAVEAQRYCNDCRACRQGLFNQCLRGEDHGFTLDGGTAEYVVVHERQCHPLNGLRERFSERDVYEIGALAEPTSIAYNGMFLRAGGFHPGRHVVIFGCGPVGLAATALARAAGAAQVIAVDTQAERRALAVRVGADVAIDPLAVSSAESTVADEVLALTRGVGAALIVEATGAGARVMPDIDRSLALAGKVVYIGVESGHVPIRTIEYQMRAGTAYGSLGHLGGGFGAAIELHAAGRLDLRPLVTSRFTRSEGVAAMEQATARRDAKILITPDEVAA